MKILMLTWEYPPRKVGGVASHCENLARNLVQSGNEVSVITYGEEDEHTVRDGVDVYRVSTGPADDILTWTLMLNHKMQKKASELTQSKDFDVIHAHDWSSVPAASSIKKATDLPFIFTLHSTERGRSGIHSEMSKTINDLEWYGTYEADEVITVGEDFKNEVSHHFSVPEQKLHYIPNGVEYDKFKDAEDISHEVSLDWENIVLFVGRLCHQKGVRHLIEAMPRVLNKRDDVKFVVAGGGPVEHYRNMARSIGIDQKALFAGFVSDEKLLNLYHSADTTVMPSVYEPFGIVALESMATKTPVVGSYTGGLKETIVHEWCGLHVQPRNPDSIAWGIDKSLSDPTWNDWMGKNGEERVRNKFTWTTVTIQTMNLYEEVTGTKQ